MNLAETFRTAFNAIAHRKLRSALTMLGILIGIASVMLTVGLGAGAQQSITERVNKLGSNLLMVTQGSGTGLSTSGTRTRTMQRSTESVSLTLADAAALADKSANPDIGLVAPVSTSSLTVSATYNGTTNSSTESIVGTTPDWQTIRNRTLAKGRFFTANESTIQSRVAVLGSTTAESLFGSGVNPVGQTITISNQTYTVIGMLDALGTTLSGDEDSIVVIPAGTYATNLTSTSNMNNITSIYLEATSSDTLSAAYQQATNTMMSQRGVNAQTQNFTVSSQQALVETLSSLTAILSAVLGGIAAISLLVGGIGVMNIMLVSVTERVREIGLRKALGAKPRSIRWQFLVEASLLGLMGGGLGVALGFLGAFVIPKVISQPVVISPWATLLALGVSLLIGIVAGVYPAARAARLAPIDALRNE
jgi:putative ABC transport system permease protein